jgi:hypothetical protein
MRLIKAAILCLIVSSAAVPFMELALVALLREVLPR